jgi:CAI-1 autoinducer synthase
MQHEVAGFSAVLDIIESEEWRRVSLHANHAYLKAGLDRLGYNVDASKTQIIALEAGDVVQTTILRDALEKRGVFGAIFFPPATPEKRCLIRFTLNCGLSRRELDRIIAVCGEIREEVGMAEWRSTKRRASSAQSSVQRRAQPTQAAQRAQLDERLLSDRRDDRQLYRKGGADIHHRSARDHAPAALDDHSAK